MLTSMTGFGKSKGKGALLVEILSVNRKYLEVAVALPRELSSLEYEVRKWVGKRISRGQVTVKVQWTVGVKPILPDVKGLRMLKGEWERIAKAIGISAEQITLPFLLQMMPESGVIGGEKELQSAVEEALVSLVKMKREEGKALERDMRGRLVALEKSAAAIEKLVPMSIDRARQKLAEKLQGLIDPKEIAMLAEKGDVTEELVRLRSHTCQMEQMFGEKEAIGRKLDFLAQEIAREVNTIGSKAPDVVHYVVEMKSELEKMREQIQNVE